ncbi:MAG: hypothetical protein HWN81_11665 [Candidatus Lokiarchaeota archaeon]|nr:hypothetical protein [Candidatus Lokiarchaeota archaeon]
MQDQFYKGYSEKTNISVFDKKSYLRLDIKFAEEQRENDVLTNAVQEKILGKNLLIAPLEYVLIGKILYLGNVEDVPDSELFEYQDVIDFLTLFHVNKEKIDFTLLEKKIKELGLNTTLKRLKEIKLE